MAFLFALSPLLRGAWGARWPGEVMMTMVDLDKIERAVRLA
jgi:hypothetical protein